MKGGSHQDLEMCIELEHIFIQFNGNMYIFYLQIIRTKA